MTVDRAVMAFAGTLVIVSVILSLLHSPYWLILAGFVGVNLFQASFTGFCPAARIFKAIGLKPGPAF